MVQVINQLETQIPGFNHQPLTWDDFRDLTDQENILVAPWDFPPTIRGFYYRDEEGGAIGLNHTLTGPEKEIVAWHELGHHYLGHGNALLLETETYLMPGIEYRARVFSALALAPTPALEALGDEILAPWPLAFREFRWRVYQTWLDCSKNCSKFATIWSRISDRHHT